MIDLGCKINNLKQSTHQSCKYQTIHVVVSLSNNDQTIPNLISFDIIYDYDCLNSPNNLLTYKYRNIIPNYDYIVYNEQRQIYQIINSINLDDFKIQIQRTIVL